MLQLVVCPAVVMTTDSNILIHYTLPLSFYVNASKKFAYFLGENVVPHFKMSQLFCAYINNLLKI